MWDCFCLRVEGGDQGDLDADCHWLACVYSYSPFQTKKYVDQENIQLWVWGAEIVVYFTHSLWCVLVLQAFSYTLWYLCCRGIEGVLPALCQQWCLLCWNPGMVAVQSWKSPLRELKVLLSIPTRWAPLAWLCDWRSALSTPVSNAFTSFYCIPFWWVCLSCMQQKNCT